MAESGAERPCFWVMISSRQTWPSMRTDQLRGVGGWVGTGMGTGVFVAQHKRWESPVGNLQTDHVGPEAKRCVPEIEALRAHLVPCMHAQPGAS